MELETNRTLPRAMAILAPVRVFITDIVKITPTYIEIVDFPSDPENSPKHLVPLEREIFIEREDFSESDDDPNFRGLTLKQVVGLRHAGCAIELKSIHRQDGHIDYLEVIRRPLESLTVKPKSFIQWVCAPLTVEIRLNSKNLNDQNDSNFVQKFALVDVSVKYAQPYQRYYFERLGPFTVEPDSRIGRLIFSTEPSIVGERLGKVQLIKFEKWSCITQ